MKAVEIDGVYKSYNGVEAVAGVSFDVGEGELFGLIGPDGAGKTTLFKMMTSLVLPDKGTVKILGLETKTDFRKIRKVIGYMPGRFSLYQDLSVQENLHFFATIFGTSIAEKIHLIKDIYQQLEPFKNRRAGKLSGGMKQKLALCCALIHDPLILFLDEPTTGVDAVSRVEFWDILKKLKKQGISIIVSTPYMDEAVKCERIALVQSGKFLDLDTPENLSFKYQKPLYAVGSDENYRLLKELRLASFSDRVEPFGMYLHLTAKSQLSVDFLKDFMRSKGHRSIFAKPINATIEDLFLDLM